jgi:hypothetical protein
MSPTMPERPGAAHVAFSEPSKLREESTPTQTDSGEHLPTPESLEEQKGARAQRGS